MAVRVVRDNSRQVLSAMSRQVEQATAKAAFDTEAGAKAAAPVATGFLRDSIQAVPKGRDHWIVGVGAAYGKHVEYGTYKAAAQPYLMPIYRQVSVVYRAALRSIKGR